MKLPSQVRIAFETMDLTLATSAHLMDEYRMDLDLSQEGMPAWAFGLSRPGKDFMVRAKRAGYSSMVYENCQRGATKPEEAHVALTRSTEHHRNMVRSDIYEMATAKAVRIWVQNFGQETGFRERLNMGAWWKNGSIAKAAKAAK